MERNEYNNEEKKVDVPYYTRDLSDDNKFRLKKRIIKADNVIQYRRSISEINVDDKYFFVDKLNQIISNSVKLIK